VSDWSQSYANHVRVVPGFHYGGLGVFALNVLWSLVRRWRIPGILPDWESFVLEVSESVRPTRTWPIPGGGPSDL
jgi:hypothetical protein